MAASMQQNLVLSDTLDAADAMACYEASPTASSKYDKKCKIDIVDSLHNSISCCCGYSSGCAYSDILLHLLIAAYKPKCSPSSMWRWLPPIVQYIMYPYSIYYGAIIALFTLASYLTHLANLLELFLSFRHTCLNFTKRAVHRYFATKQNPIK